MHYLVIRLYGHMASWGEAAVGEVRHTANRPSHSALVGLIAAALGIKREQEDQQKALAQGYEFAIKQVNWGRLMRDYHTTQVPDSVGKFEYLTRRDEMIVGEDRLGTNLSSREYLTDSLAIVAIKALENAPYDLAQIQAALLKPRFHLYLGRKACPIAVPIDPQLIEAVDYYNALQGYQQKPICVDEYSEPRPDEMVNYYWSGEMKDFAHNEAWFDDSQVQTLHKSDVPTSRKRWQFGERQEHYLAVDDSIVNSKEVKLCISQG